MAKNSVELLPLKDQLRQMLEEARVVLPGIQALFGFQLIAVFNSRFAEVLSASEQRIHLWALGLTTLSIAICMSPAALRRQSEPESVSDRLVKICTVLLTVGMAPLPVALSLDFYLISRVILKEPGPALLLAAVIGFAFLGLWYILPYTIRMHLKRPEP